MAQPNEPQTGPTHGTGFRPHAIQGTYSEWPGAAERRFDPSLYEDTGRHADDHGSNLAPMLLGGAIGLLIGIALNPTRKAVLQGAEAATGDWYDILKAEHEGVERAFHALLETRADQKRRRQVLLTQIAHALNKHAATEENVVYPALRSSNPDAAKKLGTEHLDIKSKLSELQYDIDKDDPAWIHKARELRDLVVEHARDEETRVFPPFRQSMSDDENRSLNRRLHWEGLKVA